MIAKMMPSITISENKVTLLPPITLIRDNSYLRSFIDLYREINTLMAETNAMSIASHLMASVTTPINEYSSVSYTHLRAH